MQKYIVYLLAVSLFTACTRNSNQDSPETPSASSSSLGEDVVELTAAQAKVAGIKVGRPELKDIHSQIRVNGVVEASPQNILSITFPLGGYVKSIRLLPGVAIKKGAVVATIEDNQLIQLQQDYLMNKSKLEFAAADYQRQEALNKSKSNSDKVFQQAKADYESQRIQVKALSEKLRLIGINPASLNENSISRAINIYSPINGYVSRVNVNPGKYVNPTDVLFELIDPSDPQLSLTVFEKDASSIKAGQKVTCFTTDNAKKKITATVFLVTPNISEERSVEVHCHFDQPNNDLKPGTFITAEIQTDNVSANALPDQALVRWHNQYYVFIEKSPNIYEMKEVKPGISSGGFTAVNTDLKSDKIVVENAYTLLMKLKNSAEEG